MVGNNLFFLRRDDAASFFQATDNTVDGGEELFLAHAFLAVTGSNQGGFVAYVGDVGTRESWGLLGKEVEVNIRVEFQLAHMHLKDPLALVEVRQFHMNLAVEAAGTQEGTVQHVGTVGGGENDDTGVARETVHLGQQLVKRALALVVGTAHDVLATGTANGVNLVDEDDAGRFFLGGLEQVAYTRGTYAHKHFHKVRT